MSNGPNLTAEEKAKLQERIDEFVRRGFRIIKQDNSSAHLTCSRFRYLGFKGFLFTLFGHAVICCLATWRSVRHGDRERLRIAMQEARQELFDDVNIYVSVIDGKVIP